MASPFLEALSAQDTIYAVATGDVVAALSIIRLSGPSSVEILRKTFKPFPDQPESHKVYVGNIVGMDGSIVDEVVATVFLKGRSFTGEETVEITCHGNALIRKKICDLLAEVGARPAIAGEFSLRALRSGRIDLVQAEAIHDLIASTKVQEYRRSINHLAGRFSSLVRESISRLLKISANLEGAIDFSEEDISPETLGKIEEMIRAESLVLHSNLGLSFGEYQKSSLPRVLLVGPPNSGKSSLLNYLAGEKRALVSDVPGTTRDYIDIELMLPHQKVLLIDAAGLRETD